MTFVVLYFIGLTPVLFLMLYCHIWSVMISRHEKMKKLLFTVFLTKQKRSDFNQQKPQLGDEIYLTLQREMKCIK